eukprot:gene20381-31360_t
MSDEAITFKNGKLSAVCAELQSFMDLKPPAGKDIEALDVTENEIRTMQGLEQFSKLKTLILDSNECSTLLGFPLLRGLETLWANKNKFEDLETVLDGLADKTPRLHYLSLLGNPICKSELSGSSREEATRYRIYVAHRLPTLKFLDASPITDDERKQAKERGAFLRPAKPQARATDVAQAETFYNDAPQKECQHATFL